MARHHLETHQSHRIGWLRAAVLGANDGIISTASLMVSVAASGATQPQVLLAGLAGLSAGALAMAAGEYVSVQSQADTEAFDLAKERAELLDDPAHELAELAAIYRSRGLDAATAAVVAQQLTAHDALGSHARDELGITETLRARPIQAALSSAAAFAAGAGLPVIAAAIAVQAQLSTFIMGSALLSLALLGYIAARAGGSHGSMDSAKSVGRMVLWGVIAMGCSALIGRWFGVALG
jgi:vacuolar iron transporter family protein